MTSLFKVSPRKMRGNATKMGYGNAIIIFKRDESSRKVAESVACVYAFTRSVRV